MRRAFCFGRKGTFLFLEFGWSCGFFFVCGSFFCKKFVLLPPESHSDDMRLLLFNPENDLALASNDPHYTPPASARQMARELADLPYLWAEPDDLVLRSDGTFEKKDAPSFSLLPWGWSPLLVCRLRNMGIPSMCLPSETELEDYRNFASRETAVRLLKHLRMSWPEAFAEGKLVGKSCWCTVEKEVQEAYRNYGAAMLKMPWSGSGRGVHPIACKGLTDKDMEWVRRTLDRQGGVEVEPLYKKVQDFAMEFWASGGRVRYEGLSVFETTAGGVYAGNLVASETEKEARLARFIDLGLLHQLRERLVFLFNDAGLPAWYNGPLGIDMMVVADAASSLADQHEVSFNEFSLHPLVEINLRMTMGWVALHLQQKLDEKETGTFRILLSEGHYRAVFIKKGVQTRVF